MVHSTLVTQRYQPTLHRLPDDTSGRFRIIREFLLGWHGLDTGAVGRTVVRVDQAEARIGKTLPLAAREWIVLLDDLSRLDAWSQVLRDCWGLKKVPNCPAFSLLGSGEDDCHWGPFFRDLAREDPPTSEFVRDYERSESRFKHGRQVAPRVSTWAIEFIISYLRLSRSVQYERGVAKPTLDKLRNNPAQGSISSQIGHTELVEFDGGLIHAEPDGPTSYHLRCYAPYRAEAPADYHKASSELGRRIDAMLGVIRL
jgi:hypothetical protein